MADRRLYKIAHWESFAVCVETSRNPLKVMVGWNRFNDPAFLLCRRTHAGGYLAQHSELVGIGLRHGTRPSTRICFDHIAPGG
jgi:hypothetical protein